MAPGVTINDLFLVDIWVLGLNISTMINPNLKYPFHSGICPTTSITSQEELKEFICSLLSQRRHPLPEVEREQFGSD